LWPRKGECSEEEETVFSPTGGASAREWLGVGSVT
jgi:hypothetical protein